MHILEEEIEIFFFTPHGPRIMRYRQESICGCLCNHCYQSSGLIITYKWKRDYYLEFRSIIPPLANFFFFEVPDLDLFALVNNNLETESTPYCMKV